MIPETMQTNDKQNFKINIDHSNYELKTAIYHFLETNRIKTAKSEPLAWNYFCHSNPNSIVALTFSLYQKNMMVQNLQNAQEKFFKWIF